MEVIQCTPEFVKKQTTVQQEVERIAKTAQRQDMFVELIPYIHRFNESGFIEVVPESEFAATYAGYQEQFVNIDPSQIEMMRQDVERFSQIKGAAMLSDNDGNPQKVLVENTMADRYSPPILTLVLAEELGHMATNQRVRKAVDILKTPAEIRAKAAIASSEDQVVKSTRFVRVKGYGYYFENEKQEFIGHGMNELFEELRAQIIAMYVVSHTMAAPSEKFHQGFMRFEKAAEEVQDIKAQVLAQFAECLDWRKLIRVCVNGSIDEFLQMIKSSKRSEELIFYVDQFIKAEEAVS